MPTEEERRCLFVGVRGHGGEEVYSRLVCEHLPPGYRVRSAIGFHSSCEWGRCRPAREILLNRLVHPWTAFNMGFRVLEVGPEVDIVHVHTHPTVLLGRRGRPVVFSPGSSHYHS